MIPCLAILWNLIKKKPKITPSLHQFLLGEKTISHHSQVQGEIMLDLQTKKKTQFLIIISMTPNEFLYLYLTILTLHQNN